MCEITKTLNRGGVETLLVNRLRRASAAGTRYTVVYLRASTGELVDALRAAGIELVDLSVGPRLSVYARLAATVRRLRPDVLNLHSPIPAVVLRPLVRLRGHRPLLISTVHSTHYRRLTMVLDRLTRGLDDHTVAVAPYVSRSRSVRGARRVSTRVHGVDVGEQRVWAARGAEVRRGFGVPDGAFLIVNVANLRAQKNHRALVRAAARVVAVRPDARFLLAGGGPWYPLIAAEIRRRDLGDRVRLLGEVPHAGRLVAAADLLVLSSHYEGLPVVVMEALAAGVPVVSTAVGGVPDVVESGRNGILVPSGSVDALAAALLTAMEPETHARLRAGAAASADAVDIGGTAAWFETLYAGLTAGAARG